MGLQRGACQQWLPLSGICLLTDAYIRRLQRTTFGKVPLEPGGVDLDAVYLTRAAKLYYHPVMSWPTSPFCFPAITHIQSPTRHD
jgi:hypothetical protein